MVNLRNEEILQVVADVLTARALDQTPEEEDGEQPEEDPEIKQRRDRILSQLKRECEKRGIGDEYEELVASFEAEGEDEETEEE